MMVVDQPIETPQGAEMSTRIDHSTHDQPEMNRCQAERYDLALAWPHIERCTKPATQKIVHNGERIVVCANHAITATEEGNQK